MKAPQNLKLEVSVRHCSGGKRAYVRDHIRNERRVRVCPSYDPRLRTSRVRGKDIMRSVLVW